MSTLSTDCQASNDATPVAEGTPVAVAASETKRPRATPTQAKAPAKVAHKREKLVRDSFTIPKGEYAVLGTLKERATGLLRPTKKSELLRAAVKALAEMSDKAFLAALKAVPPIKTGRPAATPVAPTPAAKARRGKDAAAPKG